MTPENQTANHNIKVVETSSGARYAVIGKEVPQFGLPIESLDDFTGSIPKEGLYLPRGTTYKEITEPYILDGYKNRLQKIRERITLISENL